MYDCPVHLVTCLVPHFIFVYICSHVYIFLRTFVLYIWSRMFFVPHFIYVYICSHVYIFPCTFCAVYLVTCPVPEYTYRFPSTVSHTASVKALSALTIRKEDPTALFTNMCLIGAGAHGRVYSATLVTPVVGQGFCHELHVQILKKYPT